MTDYSPPPEAVTTPAIPNCPDCGRLLGLYYAECATCAHHSNDYTLYEYAAALGGE